VAVSAPVASTQYKAYGASTTVGYTLSDPSTQAYPALVADFENVPLANRAISGDQACDVAARKIFPNGDSPALAKHTVSSMLVGTNDVNVKGTGAFEAIYMLCERATISWLGVPLEYKALANGTNMSTTGSGSLNSTWNAWTTGGQGATVSFASSGIQKCSTYSSSHVICPSISDHLACACLTLYWVPSRCGTSRMLSS
jgi:hypothetical protein